MGITFGDFRPIGYVIRKDKLSIGYIDNNNMFSLEPFLKVRLTLEDMQVITNKMAENKPVSK